MNSNDKNIWKRFKSTTSEGNETTCPNTNDLAFYLEGKASEDEVQAIENHLAQCPACMNELTELRILLKEESKTPTREIIENAKNLVSVPIIKNQPIIIKHPVWLNSTYFNMKNNTGYAAAAVILIFFSVLGIKLGKDTFNSHRNISMTYVSEISFGLNDNTNYNNLIKANYEEETK